MLKIIFTSGVVLKCQLRDVVVKLEVCKYTVYGGMVEDFVPVIYFTFRYLLSHRRWGWCSEWDIS